VGVTIADLLGDRPFIKENNQQSAAARKKTRSMTCQRYPSFRQHIINRSNRLVRLYDSRRVT
jgi:hypothetical protein